MDNLENGIRKLPPRSLADFLGLPWLHSTDEFPQKQKEASESISRLDLKAALFTKKKRAFSTLKVEVGAK